MSFPPPNAPADPAAAAKIKPGKGWYWLGGLLLAVGILGGLALSVAGVLNLKNTIDDFGRFKVEGGSGAATVTFEKPGTYSIYYESKSKVCTDLAQSGSGCPTETVRGEGSPPAQLDISISNETTSLDIGNAEHSLDYTLGDYSGTEVATVAVDEPGAYSMVVETRRQGDFAIAIGKDVVASIVPWIIGAVAVAAVGVILGLLTLILTAVKRGRRKRAAAMAASTQYPAAPPFGGVPAPAPLAPPVVAVPLADHTTFAPPPESPGDWAAPPAPPPAGAPPPTEPLVAPPPTEPVVLPGPADRWGAPPTEPAAPPAQPWAAPPSAPLPATEPVSPPSESALPPPDSARETLVDVPAAPPTEPTLPPPPPAPRPPGEEPADPPAGRPLPPPPPPPSA